MIDKESKFIPQIKGTLRNQIIEAGANVITYTPPSMASIMSGLMDKYRIEACN